MNSEHSLPDIKLLIAIYILLAIGLSMLYSASISISYKIYKVEYYIFLKQLIWAVIGSILFLILLNIDYNFFKRSARFFILFAIFLLILVLIPGVGKEVNNSRSWIVIKGFTFQPAEFAKFALIIYLSYIFSKKRRDGEDLNFFEAYLPALIIISIIFFLVLLQPDFGTAFILMAIAVTLTFISGVKTAYIINTIIFLLPFLYLLIFKVGYRKFRILTFLNPWSDPTGMGYNIIQSIKCFSYGKIFGVGFGKGIQKLYYLPQAHTDFIFSVVAEELGLLGILWIIFIYVYIIYRIFRIIRKVEDRFAFFYSSGVLIMLSYQTLINLFVCTGLIPVTGTPLPFISYGGSSLIINMVSLGIVLNISREINRVNRSEVILSDE
jgi:cell division protein FtsW